MLYLRVMYFCVYLCFYVISSVFVAYPKNKVFYYVWSCSCI